MLTADMKGRGKKTAAQLKNTHIKNVQVTITFKILLLRRKKKD